MPTPAHFRSIAALALAAGLGAPAMAQETGNEGYVIGSASRSLPEERGAGFPGLAGTPDSFTLFTPSSKGMQIRIEDPLSGAGETRPSQGARVAVPGVGNLGIGLAVTEEREDRRPGAPADSRVDLGAALDDRVGPFTVTLAGRYGSGAILGGDAGSTDRWATGISFGISGFTVGGSFADQIGDEGGGRAFDLGIGYRAGPLGLSIGYLMGQNLEFSGDPAPVDQTRLSVGLEYQLGGVDLSAYGAFTESTGGEPGPDRAKTEGFVIGTGISFDF